MAAVEFKTSSLDNSVGHAIFEVHNLGQLPYQEALDIQRCFHGEVVAKSRKNSLIFLEHPSVFTAGKRTDISEYPQDGTPVIEVDRGGKITWHGPGQIIGYPIVALKNPQELVGFVRTLEEALIATCAEFDIEGVRIEGRSGVWVRDSKGDRKIAAIGVRVARGVTMHGLALNVNPDLSAFDQIIPCGINDAGVTSLQKELTRTIGPATVLPTLQRHLLIALEKVCV